MNDVIAIRYTGKEIIKKRRQVERLFIEKSPNVQCAKITEISNRDLRLLFDLYDEVFFQGWFKDNFKGKLAFSFSRRMTKSAGITTCPKNADWSRPESFIIEVKISIDFIFRYGSIKGANMVNGIETRSNLQAMQLIFEHELVHVIEFVHFQHSNCKKEQFKTLARNLFGHTESYHRLATNQQIAREKLGLSPGDSVRFPFEGKKLEGVLYRINKRAIVMVLDKDGPFADKEGNRYTKYYVPLQIIQRIK